LTTTTTPAAAPIIERVRELLTLLEGVQAGNDENSRSAKIVKARDDLNAMLATPAPFVLEMNADIEAVLSRTSHQAANISRTLRRGGQTIAKDNDAEVAASTLFLLNHYFAAGPDWQDRAQADMERMKDEHALGIENEARTAAGLPAVGA
jgi:hypothetical protein